MAKELLHNYNVFAVIDLLPLMHWNFFTMLILGWLFWPLNEKERN
jgi:hypothetical protein